MVRELLFYDTIIHWCILFEDIAFSRTCDFNVKNCKRDHGGEDTTGREVLHRYLNDYESRQDSKTSTGREERENPDETITLLTGLRAKWTKIFEWRKKFMMNHLICIRLKILSKNTRSCGNPRSLRSARNLTFVINLTSMIKNLSTYCERSLETWGAIRYKKSKRLRIHLCRFQWKRQTMNFDDDDIFNTNDTISICLLILLRKDTLTAKDPSVMSPGGSTCNCVWPVLLCRRSW